MNDRMLMAQAGRHNAQKRLLSRFQTVARRLDHLHQELSTTGQIAAFERVLDACGEMVEEITRK